MLDHFGIKPRKLYNLNSLFINYIDLTVNTTFFDKSASKWLKTGLFWLFFLRFLVRGDKKTRHNLSVKEAKKNLKTQEYIMLKLYKN